MSLTKKFTGVVCIRLHKNPPIYHINSDQLGNIELDLADLDLTEQEIEALEKSRDVQGEYVETESNEYRITSLRPA